MDKLYIVIPAYNEQDNIEQVINDWYPVIEKHNGNGQSRLIVIDDGSKDSTYEKLKQCTKTRPLLIPITKPNGGHGATVLYGYKYALKNGADYINPRDVSQVSPESFHDIRSVHFFHALLQQKSDVHNSHHPDYEYMHHRLPPVPFLLSQS